VAAARLATRGADGDAYHSQRSGGWWRVLVTATAARLRGSGGSSRVTPKHGDEEETSVEARTSDVED
jgi:hypothetical protein